MKSLPDGSRILVRDMKKALEDEDFLYFKKGERRQTPSDGVAREHWDYYFTVFHNSEEFGLPHGRGWLDELPWVIPFLTHMRYIKRMIELSRMDTPSRGSSSINPQDIMGSQ